jgi:hypothetical protein
MPVRSVYARVSSVRARTVVIEQAKGIIAAKESIGRTTLSRRSVDRLAVSEGMHDVAAEIVTTSAQSGVEQVRTDRLQRKRLAGNSGKAYPMTSTE